VDADVEAVGDLVERRQAVSGVGRGRASELTIG